jgi:glycosyltransferase involved in cell wall biosynthesis
LPAFNEGAELRANLERAAAALALLAPELLVVDDGSADDTAAVAERAAADGLPVRLVRRPENGGKGAALACGFAASRGDLVAFLDADLEIAPEHLLAFEAVVRRGEADVVVGVRAISGSPFPRARRVLSAGYRRLVRALFGLALKETQAGIKLFRREVLSVCMPHVRAERFAFDVELLALCERFGFRIAQLPVTAEYRREGRLGRIRWRQVAGMALETLAIWYRSSSWVWLAPGAETRLWMVAFGIGLLLAGAALGPVAGRLVARLGVWQIPLPDASLGALAVVGLLLAGVALVQLNKSLVGAFARAERQGLWIRKGPADSGEEP